MNEEWKDIKGYEGKYQVSNLGRIKSLKDRYGNYREKILSMGSNKGGYKIVKLYKNGKGKPFYIHKLVALHFIPNPNNYPIINHKDENKQNNKVSNLEWCTHEYNNNYGTKNKRVSEKLKHRSLSKEHKKKISEKMKDSKNPRARKVQCITTGKKFSYIKEAGEYYYIDSYLNIIRCCKGERKSAGKHPVTGEKLVWKYID